MESDISRTIGSVASPRATLLAGARAEPLTLARSAYPQRIVRRAVDFGVSAVVLVVTLPLMLVIAAIIKWDSPGPALFWQL